jgi:anti-sigma regulatory factor (Ser/Thr protein kinase)
MMRGRLRSLQVRLALRLAALYVAGTAVAIGVLIYQAYDTAGSLYDRELSQRAEDLSKAVSRDSAGAPRVELSQQLASAYVNSDADIFAVRDSSGRILGASPPEFGQRVAKWPRATDEPGYFHLSDLGSRLDAVSPEMKPIELDEVVRSVVAAMAPWAIAQGRSVAFVGSPSPVQILANDDALADAVRNLIENGVMHSPPGKEVAVIVHADGRISVADRGRGVPVEEREKIFDRFWTAPGTNVRGAGLGLAIVREIMKAHRGSVTVEDHPGGGARFVLAFPLP